MSDVTVRQMQDEILEVFAEVTRYPREILDPQASLEEDLGIDSVKLGEIFAVLRERYDLTEDLAIPPASLRTIAGMSAALETFLSQGGNGGAPAPTLQPESDGGGPAHAAPPSTEGAPLADAAPRAGDGVPSREAMSAEILEVFAEVTRYPREILDPQASLEEDLGIDSVKLGEIFAVLRERYDLAEDLAIPPESLRTIAGMSTALEAYLSKRGNGGPPTPAAALRTTPVTASQLVSAPGPGHSTAEPTLEAPGIATSVRQYADHRVDSFASLTPELKPFRGKVAFVSGSGRGLGKDIAIYLAELGASVVVNSFHSRDRGEETTEEIVAGGGEASHLWGSMANNDQLQGIFDRIEEMHGTLDFFISNASNGMLATLEDLTVEHWEKAFRTNVVGLHQGAMRAAGMMKHRGGGKIITLSSPAAHGHVEYFGCMGAVKAAVESLTRAMAVELAPYDIQVNCVSPGPIDGELLRKWPESDRLVAEWKQATPNSRLCEPRDVSHFVAYLLSDPVKLFTGSTLVQDGGISSRGW